MEGAIRLKADFNDQGRAYNATAAHDSWQRQQAFFGEHLQGR